VAVKIRLMRVGKKKQPFYRVVVADERSPRDGRFIEIIGQYDPRREPTFVNIDGEKALGWLRNGAQPTEQVQKLLASTGVWDEFAKGKKKPPKVKPPKQPKAKEAPAEEAPAAEASDAPAEDAPADEGGE
jgi:small subunit ribosomal protein S16